MAVNVQEIADQIFQGMKGELKEFKDDELNSAKARAKAMAEVIADAAEQLALGNLTKAEAEQMVQLNADAAAAGLEADLGIVALRANSAIRAGLKIVVNAALGAAGLGWLAPIANGVLNP